MRLTKTVAERPFCELSVVLHSSLLAEVGFLVCEGAFKSGGWTILGIRRGLPCLVCEDIRFRGLVPLLDGEDELGGIGEEGLVDRWG